MKKSFLFSILIFLLFSCSHSRRSSSDKNKMDDLKSKMASLNEIFIKNKITDSASLKAATDKGLINQDQLMEIGEQMATVLYGPDQTELGYIARNEQDKKLRKIAIKKLTDQDELGNVSRNEQNKKLRKIAIIKLTNQDELGNVARNEQNKKLRKIAIRKLTDQEELGNIARNEQDKTLREIAIRKLTDPEELGDIARNEQNKKLRKIAIKKLAD